MINLEINHKEIDGAIFLSETMPYRCLKRWWEHTTKMLDHTIEFFQFCENLLIEINLDSQIKIPMIYERGSDWVLMDYDPSTISLNQIEKNEITTVILDELYKACTDIMLILAVISLIL